MNPELWTQIADISGRAMELPPPEREAWVRKQCDGEVLEGVLDMLAANGEMGDFLDAKPDHSDIIPTQFGRYQVIREIGQGGMSVVYLGERAEAEFTQRVAIKLILQSASLEFPENELRILAKLEHPAIARFLDTGITPSGFRYLVLEYVEGERCTKYCANKNLNETQRLNLFLQICAGVQHANRSLIVHRDLKPANILVTAEGIAKLLDFGIAKVLSTEATQHLTTGARAFTVDYAAPEQVLGEPVTLATDVYSLGVLFCEMLGGAVPRTFTGLPLSAVIDGVQKEIGPIPLSGDIEQIARKALRRDPAQRYESASAMARDIERYLAGNTIEARPMTWGYRTSRFLKRNRYAASFALLSIVALAASTAYSIRQANIAAHRFDLVRGLSKSILFDLHDSIAKLPGSLAARQLLVTQSLGYLDALAQDEAASPQLQSEVARGYLRLSMIEGTAHDSNLGQSKPGLEHAKKAVAILRRLRDARQLDLEGSRSLAKALSNLAYGNTAGANSDEAIELAREAARDLEQIVAGAPSNLALQNDWAEALHVLANAYTGSKAQSGEALAAWQRVVDLRKSIAEADPVKGNRGLGRAYQFLSTEQFHRGLLKESEFSATAAYTIHKKAYEAGDFEYAAKLAMDVGSLAAIAGRKKDMPKALSLYREQLVFREAIAQRDPDDATARLNVTVTRSRLGYTSANAGNFQDAIAYGEHALRDLRSLFAADFNVRTGRELFLGMSDLARSYNGAKQPQKACTLAREAVALLTGPLAKVRIEPASIKKTHEIASSCPGSH